jgi:UDP-glucose 4-epimerase
MRYLITGGAGFIGSHLAEHLLARGDRVTVIDDLSTGSLQNVRHVQHQRGFSLVTESMANRVLLERLVRDCDQVFHLAAAVGVQLVVASPVHTIETNVGCTSVLLDVAGECGTPVFIASTSEVYGKSTAVPFLEDGDLVLGATTRGRWSYACSKAIDEFLAIAYWRERQLPVVIARFFNTIGPRQTGRYGMVVPRFIEQALMNAPLTVYGDGSQTRCFTHVNDAVRAAVGLMDATGTTGEVFNVGSTEEVTIADLARRVIALTESSSTVRYVPFTEAYGDGFEDMPRRVPALGKIRSAIGYEPTFDLDATLRSVIEQVRTRAAAVA